MKKQVDGIVLFSGGLDSLLAARILQEQNLNILCAHFVSPFFGDPGEAEAMGRMCDMEIQCHDVGDDFARMLLSGPRHGFGKVLNPCVDCKILLLRKAKELMTQLGAKFVATGEVLGQRPMSQRRDSMDIIRKEAQVEDVLLRPLSALHLPPSPPEQSGMVDREKLLGITGRGRNDQLALAKKFGFDKIPSPGGGCVLTELENGRRYWQVIKKLREQGADNISLILDDFTLARTGRQFWRLPDANYPWLCIGRHKTDNQNLLKLQHPEDLTMKLVNFPGPLALARQGSAWPAQYVREAASLLAASCGKTMNSQTPVQVSVFSPTGKSILTVMPNKLEDTWNVPTWEDVRKEIHKARIKAG